MDKLLEKRYTWVNYDELNIRQKICIRQNTKSEIYEKLVNSGYNLPPMKENGMTLDFLSGLLVDKYFIPKCDLVIEETKYNKQIIIYLLKVYIENDPNNTFQSSIPNWFISSPPKYFLFSLLKSYTISNDPLDINNRKIMTIKKIIKNVANNSILVSVFKIMCGDPMKFLVLHSEIEIALLKYYKSQRMNPQGILNKKMELFALKYIKKLREYENFGENI